MAVSYFDPAKHGETQAQYVLLLAAVLAQSDTDGKLDVLAYVSKTLSPVEQQYLQTERLWQGFGDVFIFQLNLLAGAFTLSADYKSLGLEFNNPSSCPPS